MLLQFKLTNYRSIASEQVLSLVPTTTNSEHLENIISNEKYSALNVIAIYGANSSGKSNILNAIQVLDQLVFLSSRTNSTTALPYDPNLLIEGFDEKPTQFEITFVIEGVRYRYGVEYNLDHVLIEYLFRKKIGREVEIFYRKGETIEVSSALNAKALLIDAAIESTRSNSLFLSACDQFNIDEAKTIFSWFERLISVDGLNTRNEGLNTLALLDDDKIFRPKIVRYLKNLDLGFNGIKVSKKKLDSNDFSGIENEEIKSDLITRLNGKIGTKVETMHNKYSIEGKVLDNEISWILVERESAGTLKAFQLSGPIIFALSTGGVLVVDEIEAKLHTKLTQSIISLFLDPTTNPKGAQLVFATHDTNLLDSLKLRRDQINFVSKGKLENTELYSLSDIVYKDGKKERIETDKERRYLEDRYGATPNIKLGFNLMEN